MESNFLRKFVSLFEGTEVPERFSTWAGISCLSAMLERRIWIDMNLYVIYPNTFIVFVADSGRMRKSTAIKVTQKLLAQTDPGPRLIAQKITPEALIDALRVHRSDNPKELLKETCGGIVVADELVSFLNRDTYERGLGSLMIILWDCPNKHEYRTRNRPTEEIHFGHLSLLGGSTVHTLREAIPMLSLGDGFTSRVLFIYEDRTPKPVPRPVQSLHFKRTEEELVQHLQKLSILQGAVTLSKEAERVFDEEYERFYYSEFYNDVQFQAYASRRDKHLLKVAMCLMAAEGVEVTDRPPLTITPFHLQGARILLEDIEGNMKVVFDRIAMSESGSLTEEVYRTLKSTPQGYMLRTELLKKFGHRVDAGEFEKIIQTLKFSGRVALDTEQNKLIYRCVE